MGKLLTFSGSIFCFLAACLIAAASAADPVDNCPPADKLLPCRCDEEGISCIGVMDLQTLQKSLHATKTVRVYQNLWVQGTSLTAFPPILGKYLKSENFFVEFNPYLTTVGNLNAFWPSNNIINTLSLYGNKIEKISFANLKGYPRIRVINLGRNEIKNIDNNAFTQPNLTTLILRENQISSIGKNAFLNLPSLQYLDLESNLISTIGQNFLQSKTPLPRLSINLEDNKITTVDENAFGVTIPHRLILNKNHFNSLPEKSFLTVVSRMAQKAGHVEVFENPFTCKGCDFKWIVNNKDVAFKVLVGFKCMFGGIGLENLTHSNIGCSN